ncbi:response regulator [Oligoflexia bacterium]|nr:response regulator [Oligoflexia bacterium]
MNTYRGNGSRAKEQYRFPSVLHESKANVRGQAPNRALKRLLSSRPVVMMVDDDAVLTKLFKTFFKDQGLKVEVFTDPAEALHWYSAHHQRVGLVFLDIQMPKISGPDCFANIVVTDPRVKVAYMSGTNDEALITELMKPRQARAFFEKPVDYWDLINWSYQQLQN